MKLALFDMDHTLISTDSSGLWNEFLFEKGFVSEAQKKQRQKFLNAYFAAKLDINAAYAFELDIIQQLPINKRLVLREEFFHSKLTPFLSHKGMQCIQQHREKGAHIIMITATVDFIAEPVAQHFNVDTLIASQAEMIEGKYTGKFIPEPCIGKGKLVCLNHWLIKQNINPTHITFYSDSQNDLPLLYKADKAIAVDPDPVLKKVAQDKQWDILSFLN